MRLRSLFAIFAAACFQASAADIIVRSVNNQVELTVTHQSNGAVLYSINYKGKKVILPSGLGFKFQTPAISLDQFDLKKWIPVQWTRPGNRFGGECQHTRSVS